MKLTKRSFLAALLVVLFSPFKVFGKTWQGVRYRYVQRTPFFTDIIPHNRQAYMDHLLTAPAHRGKFKREKLFQMSNQELLALHSDDHMQTVDWSLLS